MICVVDGVPAVRCNIAASQSIYEWPDTDCTWQRW